MIVVRFRSEDEHKELTHKVKDMKKFIEELEDMLEECYDEEEPEYRGSYRRHYDEEDMRMRGGRYGYRRGGMR